MIKNTRIRQVAYLESLERRELLSVTPQLVADFDQGAPSLDQQSDNVRLGNEIFFAADDGSGDVELWKSDGTSEGTVRVKDIRVGASGALPRDFVAANGRVLFTAYSDEFGRELWATDGTEHGTVLVKDLAPGLASPQLDSFTPMGGKMYFRRDQELWSTDGTDSGTTAVVTTAVGTLTSFNEQLLFLADIGGQQPQLWVSDGTTEGTTILSDEIDPNQVVAADDIVYIQSQGDLWRSDGTTEGTWRLRSFAAHATHGLTAAGNNVFFLVGLDRPQLWFSDGTIDGTRRLRSFGFLPYHLTSAGEKMFFSNDRQLWVSDGTTDGTLRVKTFDADRPPTIVTSIGNEVLLYGQHEGRYVLWQSDGTADGTKPVTGMEHINVGSHIKLNGMLYVTGRDDDGDQQLWRADGSETGTQLLGADLWVMAGNEEATFVWSTDEDSRGLWALSENDAQLSKLSNTIVGPTSGYSASLIEARGKAFFINRGQLWQSDGDHLSRLDAAPPIRSGSLTVVDDQLYFFSGGGDDRPTELWRTDGSDEGTVRLAGSEDGFVGPHRLTQSGGKVYFWAEDTDQRMKLWMFDDSQSKAVVIKDPQWPRRISYSTSMADLDGELFFAYRASLDGDTELWKADGSSDAAERIAVLPASGASLMAAESQLFMVVDGVDNSQLWRSDGTSDGTYVLSNAYSDTDFGQATVVGGRLFFLASSQDAGEELWVSDGTVAGTGLVRDIVPGTQGCSLANMVSVDDNLYFSATDESGNRGLWKSDGTAEGTLVIKETDAYPISGGDGVVYFHGSEPSTGSELWKSDGTQEGTVLVTDLNAGPDDSRKYRTTGTAAEINGRLYFAGDDGFHGYEFWQIPIDSETPSVPGDANRDGLFNSSDLVQVFQRGEYEDQIEGNSTWEDGDWNGDGDFTTADLVLAFQSGGYQAAASLHASEVDDVSLFDWTDDSDRKKWLALDPDTSDDSLQQGSLN